MKIRFNRCDYNSRTFCLFEDIEKLKKKWD